MTTNPEPLRSSAGSVFLVFLRLGLTSFGGPVAHLGYFREAFVVRRRWLRDDAYADLVALCQFLPGPASSQVGMALGLQRAGLLGLLAAWCGFTLPSAVLLVAFALLVSGTPDLAGAGWLLGLQAAAAAVVAQAVLGMARTLTPDRRRATIAAAAAIVVLLVPGPGPQVAVMAACGVVGVLWLGRVVGPVEPVEEVAGTEVAVRLPRWVAVSALVAFAALLVAAPVAASGTGAVRLFGVFAQAGSLVFGGGHVVLPLLESQTVATHLVDHADFLAGYGAAQAVPGPLFTFAAYLGAVADGSPSGLVGAAVALVAIFLPAALLVVGALPFWHVLRALPWARRVLAGVNAGVVGLLAAALWDPVITEGVRSAPALALAVAAFIALTRWSAPPWAVVLGAGLLGAVVL
ncbi:chromate efflux transporter [Curtobacterium flaccumfaciens]|uniref:chromate efflux transporter n=1 Tax=Curtobacterium flaccumfaciens TaxID=2035 RepID=UPI001BDF3EC6|nr:chromate efflux transporter [Curtobacterium flaccumfaciens]MBT1608049.1 chromate efflux transporter [Curtobacterium flaccumfaciens pv. betae]MBT1656208.1 chromate efflux transporter [Curtobacterium flaccumfaciens pv. betae]MCS0469924.1 chromate efflux transporter [Curtobacterium flaccumfaciens pv. betae]MCS0473090.1 chromate efflux transporter [Curtobacterium flaccumfaciens pv. betae]MCS0476772.1 chromate efflux transporter [Curtobacterium flaccumfaciens pv. betae]